MSGSGRQDAHLGVRTARGDFERGLVADVVREVERLGCSCWACTRGERASSSEEIHHLMTLEDARTMAAQLRQKKDK